MKRIYGILIGLMTAAAVGGSVSAQVAKQVEVTKDYIPQVAKAEKKSIEPNMVDTVTIRPDIDYTITPLSAQYHCRFVRYDASCRCGLFDGLCQPSGSILED